MKMISLVKMIILSSLLAVSSIAHAQSLNLQQAMNQLSTVKAQGLVGEQRNGYLGVVDDTATSSQIVELINRARRDEYVRIAEENGIAVAEVEALAGERAIQRTQTGHMIQNQAGSWVKKP